MFVVDHFALSEFNLVEHVVEEGFEIGEMGVDGGVEEGGGGEGGGGEGGWGGEGDGWGWCWGWG